MFPAMAHRTAMARWRHRWARWASKSRSSKLSNHARLTALSILGSLKRALGDLDRVSAWLRVFGLVNSAPGFRQQPVVINGFTELVVELYGSPRGLHARSAVGMAELPFGIPVEIEAEVAIDS